VPVTRSLRPEEIATDYERNTGRVIVERFAQMSPEEMKAVLVSSHGPFTFAEDADKAVETAAVLEEVAKMALGTRLLNPGQHEISRQLLDKHYLRKHGKNAYYGQRQENKNE